MPAPNALKVKQAEHAGYYSKTPKRMHAAVHTTYLLAKFAVRALLNPAYQAGLQAGAACLAAISSSLRNTQCDVAARQFARFNASCCLEGAVRPLPHPAHPLPSRVRWPMGAQEQKSIACRALRREAAPQTYGGGCAPPLCRRSACSAAKNAVRGGPYAALAAWPGAAALRTKGQGV